MSLQKIIQGMTGREAANVIYSNDGYLHNEDLINRGIFMPDSDFTDLERGVILNFGVIDGINATKEYFLTFVRKTNSLLQVIDAADNVVAQFYTPGQTQTGVMEVVLSALSPNTERFKALVNWDTIGSVTSFSKKIHINKQNKYSLTNEDLINRGIFMPDSNLQLLPIGAILSFGAVSGIDSTKEYYLSQVYSPTGLIQVIDQDKNTVSQYYANSPKTGIEQILVPASGGSGTVFNAVVNWDVAGRFNDGDRKNLHINKANIFVDTSAEINSLKTRVTTLESKTLTVDQLNETLLVNAQVKGEGTYGLDQSKQQYYKGKILAMWGTIMPNYPIYITHIRNKISTFGVLIQITTDDTSSPVAQYAISNPTAIKTGVEDIILSPVGGSGLTFQMSVNWDNISTDISTANKIQILKLPPKKLDTSVLERLNSLEETVSNTEELDKRVLEPPFYDVNSPDLTYIKNGCILDAWNVNMPEGQTLYLGYLRNNNTPLIQFWYVQGDYTKIAAQYYVGSVGVQSGIQDLTISGLPDAGLGGKTFKMRIDWNLVPATPIKTDLIMNTSWLRLSPNFAAFKRIYELEKNKAPTYLQNELYINIFGDVIPDSFKQKWFDVDNAKDLEILLLGDSIVGLINNSGAIDDSEAMFLPPSMNYYHWTWGLWDRIVKNKPVYDRLDAVREGVATFTKTGTFAFVGSAASDNKFNIPSTFGEWSVAANTYQSNDANAAVRFTWDLDAYEKLNIIHSLNPDGAPCKITVASGNGKVQVSTDKSVWVEANGFLVEQNSNPDNLTETQCAEQGHTLHQRHRRIWMRKVSGAMGVQTITFGRTDTDTTKYMYIWGTERWNQSTVIIQNIGRGGRTTNLLNRNISDVADRNPDLVIHSLSLANEYTSKIGTPEDVSASLMRDYNDFFFGGNSSRPAYISMRSMLSKSDNYTKWAYLVVMPHGRGTYFSGNNSINLPTTNDMQPYLKYRKMTGYVKEIGKTYAGLSVINIFDQLINEARYRGMTIEEAFGGINQYSFTSDTVHLNKLGSLMWTKYLAPIFDKI